MRQNFARDELLAVFLDATEDLPDDAGKGIDAVLAAISPEPRRVPLATSWYQGMGGDPIAQFDHVALVLHEDGTVTWELS